MKDAPKAAYEAVNQMDEENEKGEKKTQSQILIELTKGTTLFHTPDNEAFAVIPIQGHKETWAIYSKGFRLWLHKKFYDIQGKAPGEQAFQDAKTVLEGQALFEGEEHNIYIRVAQTDHAIYLDLCDDQWRAVEVTSEGWEIIDCPPVRFKRSQIMKPLPEPVKGGSIDELKSFINISDEDDWKLVIGWLLDTFNEKHPFPLLTVQGEQGSAKSTTTKVIKNLTDPSALSLRTLPNEEKNLGIASKNTWVMAFDNISGFSNSMSDALCRVSTGGGMSDRTLYTDNEESVLYVMSPVILNGIDDIAKRPDLLERSLTLFLPSISEEKRTDEGMFWNGFEKAWPKLLGALLDSLSGVLRDLPYVYLDKKPRMADFAMWATAAEKTLGWEQGEFMDAYIRNKNKATEQGFESDPFAVAIEMLMNSTNKWIGNASQLLKEAMVFVDEATVKSKAWPPSRFVRERLRRLAPALRTKGIFYEPKWNKRDRTLKLEKSETLSSLSSRRHRDNHAKGLGSDDISDDVDISDVAETLSSRKKGNNGGDGEDSDANDDVYTGFSDEEGDLIL